MEDASEGNAAFQQRQNLIKGRKPAPPASSVTNDPPINPTDTVSIESIKQTPITEPLANQPPLVPENVASVSPPVTGHEDSMEETQQPVEEIKPAA